MQILYGSEVERKLLHLSSIWMAGFIYLFPAEFNAILFFCLFAIGLCAELGYHKRWPFIYKLYHIIFGHILRSKERGKSFHLSGGMYLILSALIASIFFSPKVGVIALSIMIVADALAGLIGRKFGKTKIFENKSLQGSLTFLVVGLIILFTLGYFFNFQIENYLFGTAGVLLATLAELFEAKLKIDDNLTIVLIIGIMLSL